MRRKPEQLALPFDDADDHLWSKADSLNARTLRHHLSRRKLVARKLKQATLLEDVGAPTDR